MPLKFYFSHRHTFCVFEFAGMREPVPPILNDKLIQMTTKIGESLLIPCVAYANPRANYR